MGHVGVRRGVQLYSAMWQGQDFGSTEGELQTFSAKKTPGEQEPTNPLNQPHPG